MTRDELNHRVAAFKANSIGATLLMVLCPVAFLIFVVSYLLNSLHPSFGTIAIGIFGVAVLMSLAMTRLIARASIRANLVCPHCHVPLGGYVKYLARSTSCPKCGQPIVESV